MLKEFYDFIAKKINSYFQTAASEETLLRGETFCLKLDTEEMVVNVADALKSLVQTEGNLGEFVLPCVNAEDYKTFTINVYLPSSNFLAITGSLNKNSYTEGSSYSATLGVSGGNSPYNWEVESGTVPSGTTIRKSSYWTYCYLSGTPKAGDYEFTMKATDFRTFRGFSLRREAL